MPKKAFRFLALLTGLYAGLFIPWVHSDSSADELLGQGLHQEEVEMNYEAAIQSYRAVLDVPDVPAATAARALYQIGSCLVKLGRMDEAKQTYETLLRDYPDQGEYSTQAGLILASLNRKSSETNRSSGIVIRKITPSAQVGRLGPPSPDGKYLAYTESGTSDLVLEELSTGKIRRLIKMGGGSVEGVYALGSWSDNSRLFTYLWLTSGKNIELRVLRIDDRKTFSLHFENSLYSWDWAPDNQSILAILGENPQSLQLKRIAIEDSSAKLIRPFPENTPQPDTMEISPDGNFIAFDSAVSGITKGSDIYVWNLGNGDVNPVITDDSNDELIDWTPDGHSLLFVSDRNGLPGILEVGITEGKPSGTARLIKTDFSFTFPLCLTNDGALFYATSMDKVDVLLARFNPETVQIQGNPFKISRDPVGTSSSPIWSQDGLSLAYICGSLNNANMIANLYPVSHSICVSSLTLGGERKLTIDQPAYKLFTWSPNGKEIIAVTRAGAPFRIDAESGRVTERYSISAQAVLQDGRTAVRISRDPETHFLSYTAHDLVTGAESVIYKGDHPATPDYIASSPDGKWLACSYRLQNRGTATGQDLIAVSLENGEVRRILHRPADDPVNTFGWSHDGKEIYYTARDTADPGIFRLWKVPLAGGKPTPLDFTTKGIHDIVFHLDGTFISFTSLAKGPLEIWAMENFLSPISRSNSPE